MAGRLHAFGVKSDILRSGGPFERIHRGASRRVVRELDLSGIGAGLDPAQRRAAREVWEARMRDERRAVMAMSQLVADLSRAGAPLDVVGAGAALVHDEARHVEICAAVAEALDPSTPVYARLPLLPPHGTTDLRRRVVLSVVSLLCVGETLSAALLAEAREACTDPVIDAVLTELLRDESIHARFGWWWLDTPQGELSPEEASAIEPMLARLFRDLERTFLDDVEEGATPPGAVPADARSEVLYRVVTETIVPRLERHGVRARGAWENRRIAA